MTRADPRAQRVWSRCPSQRRGPGRRKSRRSRMAVVLAVVGVLVLAGLALLVTRMWVSQQYYVGVEGEEVVIYQGVRGEVLGVPLHGPPGADRSR